MPAEVAKKILEREGFQTPAAIEGGTALLDLINRHGSFDAWYAAIEDADEKSIIVAISGIGSNVPLDLITGSFREAARSMVELKLTDRMIDKMDRLEKASNRLAVVGIRLAVVGIVAAVVIAVVELFVARSPWPCPR
jgi:hypothetical protein